MPRHKRITALRISVSYETPVPSGLKDLHDANRGRLDLLLYLARHLAGTPLLVVATYRDMDVDRAHPLATALAESRRITQIERIHLGPLSVEGVQQLLASSSQ